MKKYRNILLMSSLMVSFLPIAEIKVDARGKNPIYNPTNPVQEVQPIEPTRESSVLASSDSEEAAQPTENTSQAALNKSKPVHQRKKKHTKKLMLNDELFVQENNVMDVEHLHDNRFDGGSGEEDSYYAQLVSEMAGTILYGRKN